MKVTRDLGLMGESTFSLWCADGGLIPNGSKIDKTGWDFIVEFPFNSGLSTRELHKSPLECKVQVKATDHKKRKLSITLSNLRRLATAQMPAFFVFIEFDGKDTAQRAFLVHIDNSFISKILKRLRQIEQSNNDESLSKRTMTISYNEDHLLYELNGSGLREGIRTHIGDDLAGYIANKKAHLESTGFEGGGGRMTFTTEGEENLSKLIDVSLGIEKEVEISNIQGVDSRFGISSKVPFIEAVRGRLAMRDVKPFAIGKVRFREDNLSAGISFEIKLYNSAFNALVPEDKVKLRIEGDFFDLQFNPFTGTAVYSYSLGEGVRMTVKKFRDAIKFLHLLSSEQLVAELNFDGIPPLKFLAECSEDEFSYSEELTILNCISKLLSEFNIEDSVDISLEEISNFGPEINGMYELLHSPDRPPFMVNFEFDRDCYDYTKETACIFLYSAPVGNHVLGAICVLTGKAELVGPGKFVLYSSEIVIEKRIVSRKDEIIPDDALASAFEIVESKYRDGYSVVTMMQPS